MKFLTYITDRGIRLGVKSSDQVVDVVDAANACGLTLPGSVDALCQQGLEILPKFETLLSKLPVAASYISPESAVTFGPAVTAPEKIICVGLNYRRHAEESGMPAPATPVLFSKFNNALTAHNSTVDISGLEQLDYEAELAIVIGKQAKNVSKEEALEHVFGYCNANDLSERALQFLNGQWLQGKSLDGFLPLGPYLVTADEAGDPQSFSIKGWLNNELRQNSNTNDMVFSVADIVSYISQYITLSPGDIICTGTPEGVILGRSDKQWMKPGDTYSVEIGPLGRLSNTLTAQPAT